MNGQLFVLLSTVVT